MDQASQVREKIDIVNLITEYIPLKKMGRNFTTNCPFHNESSPSFVVSPERQIWHCFGCGKGGDAYTFLMDYENLEFIEALRILAKKVGVTLKSSGDPYTASKKENIFALNNISTDYYSYVLNNHKAGERALDYLINERGLNEKLIKTFKIGFAPNSGEDLTNFLINKKKNKAQDLIEAGLCYQRGSQAFDFFRNRIIFPLIDHRNNIVGFSGRNILNDDFGPKYMNTRDTLVYHKGGMFFGLNLAKETIKKESFSIVMEGEFDVISAYKEGITNAVALKGTALTSDQALLLSRFAPKVMLCLDQDSAGIEAMKRSVPVLEKRGLQISVINFSEKDPDESIKKNSLEFKKAIKHDQEVYDFLLEKLCNENNLDLASGKKKISDEMLPLISSIQNEIVKEHYLRKLSDTLNTSYDSLMRQIDKKEEDKGEKNFQKIKNANRREMLEEYLLALALQAVDPKSIFIKIKDVLISYKFDIPAIGKIFAEVIIGIEDKDYEFENVSKKISIELIPTFDKSFLMPLPKFEDSTKYEEEVIRVAKELKIADLKARIKEISRELKENGGNDEEINKIKIEIATITSQISSS